MGKKKDPPPPAPLDLPEPKADQAKDSEGAAAKAVGEKDKQADGPAAQGKAVDQGKEKPSEGKDNPPEDKPPEGGSKDKGKSKDGAKKDQAPVAAEDSWSYYPAEATAYVTAPGPQVYAAAPGQRPPVSQSSGRYPAVPPPPRRRPPRTFLDCLLCRQPPEEEYVGSYYYGGGGDGRGRTRAPPPRHPKRPDTPDSQRSWKHHDSYFPTYVPSQHADESFFPSYDPGSAIVKRAEAAAQLHGARHGHNVSVHFPDLPRFAEYQTAGGVKPGTWKQTQWGVEGWTGFGWEGQRLPTAQGHFFSAPMPAGEPLKKDGDGKKKKK